VSNALALRHLRRVRPGDRVLFYHTGKDKAVVGEMVVVSEPRPASPEDDKAVVVDVEPVRRLPAVPLARIKEDRLLRDWDLVRLPRLSVLPVTPAQWHRVIEISEEGTDKPD
jgi:predicted RNA-binding protein with PUA-like domain